MVTFTINIPQMLAYIPYMDPMGCGKSWKITLLTAFQRRAKEGGRWLVYRDVAATIRFERTCICWAAFKTKSVQSRWRFHNPQMKTSEIAQDFVLMIEQIWMNISVFVGSLFPTSEWKEPLHKKVRVIITRGVWPENCFAMLSGKFLDFLDWIFSTWIWKWWIGSPIKQPCLTR